ncbi:MAG: hypothetical protein QM725_01370 [Lacibacter sp.]
MSIFQKYLQEPQVEVVHYDDDGKIFSISATNKEEFDRLFSWVDKDVVRQKRNDLLEKTNRGMVSYIHIFSSSRSIKEGLINIKKEIIISDDLNKF